MSAKLFNYFNLLVEIKCLDCGNSSEKTFRLGDTFEGPDEPYFCHTSCPGCENFIFINLKKFFPPERIRQIYDGIKTVKKEQTEGC